MAFTINQVNVAANATLQVLIDQLNKSLNAISNFVVTVNVAANGCLDTGASYPNRIFIGNSSVNTVINSSSITANSITSSNLIIGNILSNTTVFQVGSNITMNTTVLTVGSLTLNTSMLAIGNVNVATVFNRSAVSKSNTPIGERSRINFIEGTNIQLDISDNSNTGQIDVSITSSAVAGNSQPGGSNTYIQFNDSGALNGDSSLILNKNSQTLSCANAIIASSYKANCFSIIPSIVTFSNTATNILDSFILLNYRTVEYTISVKDNNSNNYQASKLLVVHNGAVPIMTEYAQLFTNTVVASFAISSNATHAILNVTPTASSNVTYKLSRDLIEI